LRLEVDLLHLGHLEAHAALAADDGADRVRNRLVVQARRRHLIQQRLEQVVVAPVQTQNIKAASGQRLRRRHAAKTHPDNHNFLRHSSGTPQFNKSFSGLP
jgi:hypothetical protein